MYPRLPHVSFGETGFNIRIHTRKHTHISERHPFELRDLTQKYLFTFEKSISVETFSSFN